MHREQARPHVLTFRGCQDAGTVKAGNADSVGSMSLALTPQGHLRLVNDLEALPLAPELADALARCGSVISITAREALLGRSMMRMTKRFPSSYGRCFPRKGEDTGLLSRMSRTPRKSMTTVLKRSRDTGQCGYCSEFGFDRDITLRSLTARATASSAMRRGGCASRPSCEFCAVLAPARSCRRNYFALTK
jgi:hypothetical protein